MWNKLPEKVVVGKIRVVSKLQILICWIVIMVYIKICMDVAKAQWPNFNIHRNHSLLFCKI